MRRASHCERLLDALADGRPHPHLELYGLGMMVHSRVADLRARGYTISTFMRRENGERVYYYQLDGRPLSEPEPTPVPVPPGHDDGQGATHKVVADRVSSGSLNGHQQLELV